MKKITVILLAVVLCLSLCACSLPFGSSTLEGKGYKTPEEALLAYANALKKADVDGILQTFAVETYAENYDMEEDESYYMPQSPIEEVDEFTKELNISIRKNEIIKNLNYFYNTFALGRSIGRPITLYDSEDYDDAGDLYDELNIEDFAEILSKMEFEEDEVMNWEDVADELDNPASSDEWWLDMVEDYLEAKADAAGCKEVVSLALPIELDGNDYFLCMDVARYGDRWYNLSAISLTAMIFDPEGCNYCGGLVRER